MKFLVITVLIFLSSNLYCQILSLGSLDKRHYELVRQVDSLKKLLSGCTDFLPMDNPNWVKKSLLPKSYHKYCKWSGTYVVLNSDSTFLYVYNGEGVDVAQKGVWHLADSILVLKSIKKLSGIFQEKMNKRKERRYLPKELYIKKFLYRPDVLVEIETVHKDE